MWKTSFYGYCLFRLNPILAFRAKQLAGEFFLENFRANSIRFLLKTGSGIPKVEFEFASKRLNLVPIPPCTYILTKDS